MEGLWVFAAVLVCPLAMGLMMVFMMRGKHGGGGAGDERGEHPR